MVLTCLFSEVRFCFYAHRHFERSFAEAVFACSFSPALVYKGSAIIAVNNVSESNRDGPRFLFICN